MEVIVLNQDFSILNTINARDAVSKIAVDEKRPPSDRKYEVLKTYERKIGKYFVPKIMRLLKAVEIIHRRKQAYSKSSLLVRDNYTCQYCGVRLTTKEAEVEHVIPKSLGGRISWENTVIACHACNQKKANRTPKQANMVLKKKPYQPSIYEFFILKIKSLGHEDILKDLFT